MSIPKISERFKIVVENRASPKRYISLFIFFLFVSDVQRRKHHDKYFVIRRQQGRRRQVSIVQGRKQSDVYGRTGKRMEIRDTL